MLNLFLISIYKNNVYICIFFQLCNVRREYCYLNKFGSYQKSLNQYFLNLLIYPYVSILDQVNLNFFKCTILLNTLFYIYFKDLKHTFNYNSEVYELIYVLLVIIVS